MHIMPFAGEEKPEEKNTQIKEEGEVSETAQAEVSETALSLLVCVCVLVCLSVVLVCLSCVTSVYLLYAQVGGRTGQ